MVPATDDKGNYVITNRDAVEGINKEGLNEIRTKSAIKAAIIFLAAAATVFVMSYLKFPVSANQSVTGAIIGWGLFYADYSNPTVLSTNITEILEFMSTWLINPLGAAIIGFVIVYLFKKFLEKRVLSLKGYDKIVKIGYIIAGAYSAYTIGINSSASVTAFYYDMFGVGANILTSARLTAILGGVAIAVGVLTYSKKVMMTVGGSIANISQMDGFLVILASALSITIMKELMGIPVSTSQAVVGAVVGAGLVGGVKNVNFGVFKRIAIAWVSSPTVAGLITYVVALCTQSYFG
jgi:PiT family inorganic phosphate transporter